jgi:hypothetical protein
MIIIALAPPGEEPQTAVEPGRTPNRLIVQPMRPLAAITAAIAPRKRGAFFTKARMMAGVMARAIRQPRIACAA